jgi:hypothetical protein
VIFGEDMIQAVWEKGRGMPHLDPAEWRSDQCGAWMHREQYGNAGSEFGWKIVNLATGTPRNIEHLQPLQWNNGFDISRGQPHCRVTADRTGLAPEQTVTQPRNRSV